MPSTRVIEPEDGEPYSDDEEHEHSWEYDYTVYHCADCGEIVEE